MLFEAEILISKYVKKFGLLFCRIGKRNRSYVRHYVERQSEIKERKVSAALQIFKERKGERRSERQVSAQKSAVFQRLYLKTNLSYTTNHSLFKRSVF